MAAFEELGVTPEIIRAVDELGWMLPTPVQVEAIPLILGGGDVAVAAETGSGKTGAFALPILQITHETLTNAPVAGGSSSSKGKEQGGPIDVKMSTDDRDPIFAVSPDGLMCQSRAERNWCGGKGTAGVSKGKFYYEATVTDEGLCRIGWSTSNAVYDLGTDKFGYGFGGTGKKSHNRQFDNYGEAYGLNDVIGCYLDMDNFTVSFSKNGVHLGEAFQIEKNLQKAAFFPAIVLKNAEMKLNFGSTAFEHNPGNGFQALASGGSALQRGGAQEYKPRGKKGGRTPLALILEPSRELAQQTHDCVGSFKKYVQGVGGIHHCLLVGGMPANEQAKSLAQGADIVTGTPGRVMDMMESGKLDLSATRFFVLDEADRLLDTGNQDAIMKIFQRFPKQTKIQVMLFSATLHAPEIRVLSEKIQNHPTWVDLKGKDSVPDTVRHFVVRLDPKADNSGFKNKEYHTDGVHANDSTGAGNKSPESLSESIKKLKPQTLIRIIDSLKLDQAMIFCRTKIDCDALESYLVSVGGGRKFSGRAEKGKENPYSCVVLHGDRHVSERRENLQLFKDADVRFLICTDVAARGLDIFGLPAVINMTLPDKSEDYVHRVGRTGRAEHMGIAISLVSTEKEKVWYHQCPSKGKKCHNVKLLANGGCTIWYDEPNLLQEVEARLHQKVPSLPSNFKVDTATLGQKKQDPIQKKIEEHVRMLRPAVIELAEMEVQAQDSFLSLKTRWGK